MRYTVCIIWTVYFTTKAEKQVAIFNDALKSTLYLLVEDLKNLGPAQPGWPNYSKLKGTKKNIDLRHCHLIKGRPTYVCCCEVIDKQLQIVEVYYVGTDEKAPY